MRTLNLCFIALNVLILVPNMYGIFQYGPLPNATFMVSSSAVLILVCAALLMRHRPITKAFAVCLVACPGALLLVLLSPQ